MALLRFDQVSFAYPEAGRRALDKVSFSMEEGEYIVVCGESGCGKTTLLRQAKPELWPAGAREGTVFYRETPLERLPGETTAMRIGYVQQNPENQIVTDYVWHELAFGLENMALPTSAVRRRVSEMASFFGMEDWFRKKTCELSGGQKQMLNLASVMAMSPELLILDEPTSMLDPLAARNLLQAVARINRELGVAVLLCEHRLEDVFQTADRALLLKKGRVLSQGTPEELAFALQKDPEASRIYLGLPGAVRIFGELQRKGGYPADRKLPLSIRDARRELRGLLGERAGADGASTEPRRRTAFSEARDKKRETVLEGRELWFRYSEKGADVLRGLSFSLRQGETAALLGGNGAGKSTLLKLLCGVEKPLRGKVRHKKGLRVAMLPQSPQALFVYDTLREDLLDGARTGDGDADPSERVAGIAGRLELTDKLDSHPFDLSGGELQRAAIARLLLQNADVLLLDEPTKGLDAYLKQELARVLERLTEDGISLLLVTHDLEFAAAHARRCALLFDGRIVSEDEPHAFFSGNRFYTTAAGLIAGDLLEGAVTCEEVIGRCMER
ncbi:MAG: energy-coupling factor transporter ATPase [Eubacteriales bacterium]|nr:energy-coupling factor transporter ATPase [Eubacteriales bacterium]